MAEIPVVDFACFNTCFNDRVVAESNVSSSEEVNKIAQEIYNAFTTIGFAYIRNHGIPTTEIEKLFEVSERFFKLPSEEKIEFASGLSSTNYHGWIAAGRQIVDPNDPVDFKEAYAIVEPYNNDIPWPDGDCSDFKETVRKFYQACGKLAHRILDLISHVLELKDRNFFTNAHGKFGTADNRTSLRLLYYPFDADIKPGQIRLGEHSDYGTITLLFQDHVGGLEVLSQNAGFMPARPIEGTVLVNIGDLLQRWTNNKLVSTRHRVVVPHDEILRSSARHSAAFFVMPDNKVVVECLDGSEHYPPVTTKEYINQKVRESYPVNN